MAWKVKVAKFVEKDLKKLSQSNAAKIIKYFREIETWDNPRQKRKPLKGVLKHYWRYRVGDYRIFCDIRDDELIILALKVGHRKDVYVILMHLSFENCTPNMKRA